MLGLMNEVGGREMRLQRYYSENEEERARNRQHESQGSLAREGDRGSGHRVSGR